MATPELASSAPLVIRTRSDAGRRWEGQFNIQRSHSASLQQLWQRQHPDKEGVLEKFVLQASESPEGIEAAINLLKERVRHWAIHWIRLGEITIREDRQGLSLIGIQEGEIPSLREAISQQIKYFSKD